MQQEMGRNVLDFWGVKQCLRSFASLLPAGLRIPDRLLPCVGLAPCLWLRYPQGTLAGWRWADALPHPRLLWPLGGVQQGGGRYQGRSWHLLKVVEGTEPGVHYQRCILGRGLAPSGPSQGLMSWALRTPSCLGPGDGSQTESLLCPLTQPPCPSLLQLAPGVNSGQGLGIEIIGTLQLVLCVLATTDRRRRDLGGSGPLAIGLSVALGHLLAVSVGSSWLGVGWGEQGQAEVVGVPSHG